MPGRVADVLFGTWQWCFLDWQKMLEQFRIGWCTPKWMVYNGKPMKIEDLGVYTPIFGNIYIYICIEYLGTWIRLHGNPIFAQKAPRSVASVAFPRVAGRSHVASLL